MEVPSLRFAELRLCLILVIKEFLICKFPRNVVFLDKMVCCGLLHDKLLFLLFFKFYLYPCSIFMLCVYNS